MHIAETISLLSLEHCIVQSHKDFMSSVRKSDTNSTLYLGGSNSILLWVILLHFSGQFYQLWQ